MEREDLRKIWKRQKPVNRLNYSGTELMMLINNRMVSLEEEIRSRDRLEIIACIILIISYGFIFFTTGSVWKQAGSLILVFSGFFIWYRLKAVQVNTLDGEYSADRPLVDHLELELEKVQRQKKLLQNVLWWYILPISVGLLLFTMGFKSGITVRAACIVTVFLAGMGIWKLNHNVVTRKFDPLIEEIREAIEFIEKRI